ncbi:MAG: hypothetical protein K6U00_00535 [Armatimonadetes bacterium]|nr:hypothetical protein [Armatimonadota bacterium]
MRNSKGIVKFTIAVFIAGLLAAGLPGFAQDERPYGDMVSLENEYLYFALGRAAKWTVPDDVALAGRYYIRVNKGDPTTDLDDGLEVTWSPLPGPAERHGFWEVMVDAITSPDAETIERTWALWGEDSSLPAGIWGDLDSGYWAIAPRVPANENVIRAVWYPNVTQGVSPSTGETVDVVNPLVRFELEARLMHDTIRFKFTIKNEDNIDHLVGMKCVADLSPNVEESGTEDFRNIISVPGYGLLQYRTVLSGSSIPSSIEMANSQMDPVHSIRMTFKGQGSTPPDKVVIDNWGVVASPALNYWYGVNPGDDPWMTWDYEPLPYDYISDCAYAAVWKPRRIAPGQTITLIHYLGLANSTSDFTKPNMDYPQYVPTVQGPRALRYYSDDSGIGHLYPEPFEITAYMANTEKYLDLRNATFTLMLPPGLTLDPSEGGKYSKTIPTIKALDEGKVSWLVVPDGSPTGILDYSVSFSASPVGGTTVTRQIAIPATEWQPLSAGWQMVSVPFALTDADPATALGLLPGFVLYKYDPYLRRYVLADRLEPGVGYWLKLPMPQTTAMMPGNYQPIQWARTQGYQIPLEVGWNMVGNPYVYAVTLGEARFYHIDYGMMDYDQAVSRGLISRTVFWWDPVFRTYRWNKSGERSVQLKPWQAYWILVLRPGVTMSISPVSQLGAAVGGQPIPTPEDGGGGLPPVPASLSR